MLPSRPPFFIFGFAICMYFKLQKPNITYIRYGMVDNYQPSSGPHHSHYCKKHYVHLVCKWHFIPDIISSLTEFPWVFRCCFSNLFSYVMAVPLSHQYEECDIANIQAAENIHDVGENAQFIRHNMSVASWAAVFFLQPPIFRYITHPDDFGARCVLSTLTLIFSHMLALSRFTKWNIILIIQICTLNACCEYICGWI